MTTVSSVRVEAATEGGGGGLLTPALKPCLDCSSVSCCCWLMVALWADSRRSRRTAAIPAAKLALRETLIGAAGHC